MTPEKAAELYIRHLKISGKMDNISLDSDLTNWLYALDYFTHDKQLSKKSIFGKSHFNIEKSEVIFNQTQNYFCEKFKITPETFFYYVNYQYQESPIAVSDIMQIQSIEHILSLLALRYAHEPEKILFNTGSYNFSNIQYVGKIIGQLLNIEPPQNVHAIGNALLHCVQNNHPFKNLIASIIQLPLPYCYIEHPDIEKEAFDNVFLSMKAEKNRIMLGEHLSVYWNIRNNTTFRTIEQSLVIRAEEQYVNGYLKQEWIHRYFQNYTLQQIPIEFFSDTMKNIIGWEEHYSVYRELHPQMKLFDAHECVTNEEINILI